MLKGDLSSFSLGEIFQSLAINNHTGTLKITAVNQPPKLIYFDRGEIRLFSDGSAEVPRLGEILVRHGKLAGADLEAALEEQAQSKTMLGEILARRGLVTGDDVREALELQIREEIYDLFLWKQGAFEFHMGYFPEELQNSLQKKAGIALNTNSVIMEGLRRLDEWKLINTKLPTGDEILVRTDKDGSSLDATIREFSEKIDGTQPVRDLCKRFPGTRFDCSKALCDLLDGGYLRPLDVIELRRAAQHSSEKRYHSQAAAYLEFAAQLEPSNASVLCELGDALAAFHQDGAAKEAYAKALRIHFAEENFTATADVGERIMAGGQLPDEDLERLYQSYLKLKKAKKAASIGNLLVTSLQKKGNLEKAAAVLGSLASLDPSDLGLKLQVASLYEKAGDKKHATACLEEVAAALEEQGKLRELVKVLRLLGELCPERKEIEQKIREVHQLEEKLERRRKRRLRISVIAGVSFFTLVVVPILYEIKAREFYSHAQRLEQISMMSMDFKAAKEAYEHLLRSYSFSSKVAEAEEALDRIANIERTIVDRMEEEAEAVRARHEAKVGALRQGLTSALAEAEAAEKKGDFKLAHEILRRVVKDYARLPAVKNVLFPLSLTSDPTGAIVTINGTRAGQTPLVTRYRPGMELDLTIEKRSCEPFHGTIETQDQDQLHFVLKRRPAGEVQVAPAVHQPMVSVAGRLVFASRDGVLYAIDPPRKIISWQRAVGRVGDKVSDLHAARDEVYLGNVIGEVAAISAHTGKSRWVARVGKSVLAAPAVSADHRWAAVGTTGSTVHIIDNANGNIVAKFFTENEILARPIFRGDLLIVGSTDNSVYGYSVSKRAPVFSIELTDDIAIDPAGDEGSIFFATADGRIHALDVASRRIQWSRALEKGSITAVVLGPSHVIAGTSTGKLVGLARESGEPAWELAPGKGAVTGIAAAVPMLYASLESGKIVAVDLSGPKTTWDYQSEGAIVAPPLLMNGLLYFGGITGKIQFIEVK
jgi:outer membrane protein assembly factor BamB/tetratricopeptide (TPR) repeat protein